MEPHAQQQLLDHEHLRLLRIGYFVLGGTAAFTGLFGLLYAGMGLFVSSAFRSASTTSRQGPPEFILWMFAVIGAFIALSAGGYAALAFLTARNLQRRQSRTLCLVTAGFSCVYIPFGTVLGIFTFSVLGRPTVISLFAPGSSITAPPRTIPTSSVPPLPPPVA